MLYNLDENLYYSHIVFLSVFLETKKTAQNYFWTVLFLKYIWIWLDHYGCVTVFFCNVTAVCDNILPFKDAPVCKLIPFIPNMVPSK